MAFDLRSHPGPLLSELMTTSSRTLSQSRARPWQWCPAQPLPPPKCCSSRPPTPASASQRRRAWPRSRPPCRTSAWPIGTRCRPTAPGVCSLGDPAHPSTPCTPPSSPWMCALCPSPRPSACRWPSQPSPGTASPPATEAATSVEATRSPQAVSTDRAPLVPTGRPWKLTWAEEEDTVQGSSAE